MPRFKLRTLLIILAIGLAGICAVVYLGWVQLNDPAVQREIDRAMRYDPREDMHSPQFAPKSEN